MKRQFWTSTVRFAVIIAGALIGGMLVLPIAATAQNTAAGSTNVNIKWVPITYVSPSDGPKMYAQYCAACHGAMGKGDGPAASALPKPPTDLSSLTALNNGRFPESRVYVVLGKNAESGAQAVQASGKERMPYWHGVFRDADTAESALRAHNLVLQVKNLQVVDLAKTE